MPEPAAIRAYEAADHPAVTRLWLAVFGALKPEDEAAAIDRLVARAPGLFLVAEADGAIVGTVIGATDGRRGFLYHVAVLPGWRRRGIAGALLAEVERRLWATGIHTIHLRVEGANQDAIAFYRRRGYATDPPVIGMRRSRGR